MNIIRFPGSYDPRLEYRLVDVFERYRAVRALGPTTRTLDNYTKSWVAYVAYLEAELGHDPIVTDLTPESLNEYLCRTAMKRGWAEQSIRSHGGNIRSVVSGFRDYELVPDWVLATFKAPKVTEQDPVFFDDATLARIFRALEADRTVKNLRLRAVANIILDCGARPNEVANLTFADLWQVSSQIRLYGKGAKVRVVPVGASTWDFLADYLRVRPSPGRPSDPVFVDVRNGTTRAEGTTLSSDMNELLIELGLVIRGSRPMRVRDESGYCLYTMKRTFGRRAAEGGMDVGELAAMMGHEPNSIPMLLRIYYRPTETHKRRAHTAARPADGLHDWRATPGREIAEVHDRALVFFERWSNVARRTEGGKHPSRTPTSRKRASGA